MSFDSGMEFALCFFDPAPEGQLLSVGCCHYSVPGVLALVFSAGWTMWAGLAFGRG